MALTRRMGSATATAMAVVRNVPANKGRTPKCFSVKSGVHWVSVRKSIMETSLKNSKVSKKSTATIPKVIKTEKRGPKKKAPPKKIFFFFFKCFFIKKKKRGGAG